MATLFPGSYTLTVRNGPDGEARTSSARILLNGQVVLAPADLNQNVESVTVDVTLDMQNTLSIEVAGEPGAVVEVSIGTEASIMEPLIAGSVIDAEGKPVPSANVVIAFGTGERLEGFSDADGHFAFDGFASMGHFVLTASANDLTGSVSGGVLESAPQASATVVVREAGNGVVSGTVRRHGEAVLGASVSLFFLESPAIMSVFTAEDGSFTLAGLPTDGTFTLIAYDPETQGSAAQMSYLTSSRPTQVLELSILVPESVNPEFTNGDFSSGTLAGWTADGDVRIVPRDSVFSTPSVEAQPLQTRAPSQVITPAQTEIGTCYPPYSGIVSTAGDQRSVGHLAQTFQVQVGMDTLAGKIRFLSDEWPQWYGSEYNDAYTVYVTSPAGAKVLAAGNLNGSAWGAGVSGYNGATAEIPISYDLKPIAPQNVLAPTAQVTLNVVVQDVGDTIIDSAVAVTDFKVEDTDRRNLAYVDSFKAGVTSFSFPAGQAMWVEVSNGSAFPVPIYIYELDGIEEESVLITIPPFVSREHYFGYFSTEPVMRNLRFQVPNDMPLGISDALIFYLKVYSSWAPGMPPNPCG